MEVKIYKPIAVPDATTQDASGVLHSEGVLHGHVDPAGAGEITSCEFQYVKDSLYNSSKFAEARPRCPANPPRRSDSSKTSAPNVTGLTARGRLPLPPAGRGTSTARRTGGQDLHDPGGAGHRDETATNVAPRSATLNGSFTGKGMATEYYYEWGTNQGYGNSTPTLTAGLADGSDPASQALPGLELETTYHYRRRRRTPLGTSKGEDMTFTTHPAVTKLETKPATSLDQENITLNGRIPG